MSSKDAIVIAGAARTPVGSFNGAFADTPAHVLGSIAIKAALERAGVSPADVDEVIMGQILTAGQGQNPARQAAIGGGHPERSDRMGPEPAVRLRLARRGARHAADRQWRCRHHRRRRPGIHVHGPAYGASARRHQDGRHEVRRHHDQGRPDRRVLRLPHGQHGRERRAPVAVDPRGAGQVRRRLAEQGRGGAKGRQVQGRDRSGHPQDPQGRRRRFGRRVHQAWRDDGRRLKAAPGLRQGRHGDGRQRFRHQ